jgi:hypothetical protein
LIADEGDIRQTTSICIIRKNISISTRDQHAMDPDAEAITPSTAPAPNDDAPSPAPPSKPEKRSIWNFDARAFSLPVSENITLMREEAGIVIPEWLIVANMSAGSII